MIRGVGTIVLATALIAGGYFSGMFNAAPKPAAASASAPGEDNSTAQYSEEECLQLRDRIASRYVTNSDLQGRPATLGQAVSQTAAAAAALRQMEVQLRQHGCLKEGNGKFYEPKAEMGPADPSPPVGASSSNSAMDAQGSFDAK